MQLVRETRVREGKLPACKYSQRNNMLQNDFLLLMTHGLSTKAETAAFPRKLVITMVNMYLAARVSVNHHVSNSMSLLSTLLWKV